MEPQSATHPQRCTNESTKSPKNEEVQKNENEEDLKNSQTKTGKKLVKELVVDVEALQESFTSSKENSGCQESVKNQKSLKSENETIPRFLTASELMSCRPNMEEGMETAPYVLSTKYRDGVGGFLQVPKKSQFERNQQESRGLGRNRDHRRVKRITLTCLTTGKQDRAASKLQKDYTVLEPFGELSGQPTRLEGSDGIKKYIKYTRNPHQALKRPVKPIKPINSPCSVKSPRNLTPDELSWQSRSNKPLLIKISEGDQLNSKNSSRSEKSENESNSPKKADRHSWLNGRAYNLSAIDLKRFQQEEKLEEYLQNEFSKKNTKTSIEKDREGKEDAGDTNSKDLPDGKRNELVKLPNFEELDQFLRKSYIHKKAYKTDYLGGFDGRELNPDFKVALLSKQGSSHSNTSSKGKQLYKDKYGNLFTFEPYTAWSALRETRTASFYHFVDYFCCPGKNKTNSKYMKKNDKNELDGSKEHLMGSNSDRLGCHSPLMRAVSDIKKEDLEVKKLTDLAKTSPSSHRKQRERRSGSTGMTVYDKFGPGVNLFFEFTKATILLFFVCSLLSLPLQYVNRALYKQTRNPNIKPLDQVTFLGMINTFLLSTTLGGLSSLNQIKREVNFTTTPSIPQKSNQASSSGQTYTPQPLILNCDYGTLSVSPNHTKFGFFEKSKSISKLMFQIDDSCTNYTNMMVSMQPCIGTDFCEVDFRRNWLRSEKRCLDMTSTHKMVVSTFCKRVELVVPFFGARKKQSIAMNYFWNFMVAALIIVFYLYYLLVLILNFRSMSQEHYGRISTPSQFALMLKDLPEMSEEEAIEAITKFFVKCDLKATKKLKERSKTQVPPQINKIRRSRIIASKNQSNHVESDLIDIQFSQTQKTLNLEVKLCEETQKFEILFKRLMKAWKSPEKASWHFDFAALEADFQEQLRELREQQNMLKSENLELEEEEEKEEKEGESNKQGLLRRGIEKFSWMFSINQSSGGAENRKKNSIFRNGIRKLSSFLTASLKFRSLSVLSGNPLNALNSMIVRDLTTCAKICKKLDISKKRIIDINRQLDEQKGKQRTIRYAFVTFRTKEHKNFFFDNLPKSKIQGWLSCFNMINMKIRGRVVVVRDPPDPINVNWWNISKSMKLRIFKRVLCYSLFGLLFLIPTHMRRFLMDMNQSRRMAVENPSCSAFGGSLSDENILKMTKRWTPVKTGFQCLCLTRPKLVNETLLQEHKLPSRLCSDLRAKSLELSLMEMLESGTLALMTFSFDFLFEAMAYFEAYDNFNEHQVSVLLKLFLWKSYLTTLLPIVLNSELIQRKNLYMFYDDFTPQWYLNIGSGLIKSAYFRLVFVLLELFFRYYWPRLLQWRDRGYSNSYYKVERFGGIGEVRMPRTRASTHKEYLGVYTNQNFDIDRCYAEVLNVVTFCFSYCFLLPHVFIPCFLMLLALHAKDKILLLTTFTSSYYVKDISYRWASYIVGLVPISTLFMSFWVFGNSVFFSTSNIIPEVILRHDGFAKTANQFGQRLYRNVSYLDGGNKWRGLEVAKNYVLDYESHLSYIRQIWFRKGGSIYYSALFYSFLGYTAFLLVVGTKMLIYDGVYKKYCFLRMRCRKETSSAIQASLSEK